MMRHTKSRALCAGSTLWHSLSPSLIILFALNFLCVMKPTDPTTGEVKLLIGYLLSTKTDGSIANCHVWCQCCFHHLILSYISYLEI